MRALWILCLAGCAGPPESLDRCVDRLLSDPDDTMAQSSFPAFVEASDAAVMRTMRAHHGTAEHVMRHYYPSHLYVRPFARACGLKDPARAEREFIDALSSVQKAGFPTEESRRFADAIAQEARRRCETLRNDARRSGVQ